MSEAQGFVEGSVQGCQSTPFGPGAGSAFGGPGSAGAGLLAHGPGLSGTSGSNGDSGTQQNEGPASTRGPFAPEVNSLLRNCFGHMVDDIKVSRGEGDKNRAIAADAHTIGNRVSLGDKIKEDPKDLHSMEVIAHEVAHALAGGGAGHHVLNQPGDAGESAAYEAGHGFKQFVAGGGHGPPPQLKPAVGGKAVIHRWESGEHVRAVDNAVDILQDEQNKGRIDGVPVSDGVKEQIARPIKLANGVELTSGQITSLMGDFYGRFKDNGDFDPAASFDQLNNADPKEMKKLLRAIDDEISTGKTASNLTLNEITADRKNKKNADGKVDLGYLDLAQKNNSHFSADNMTDPNNNMGAYSAFHEMALREAQKGDAASIERARAMEACGMHYLTDRHSSGHGIDKNGVMDAAGSKRDSYTANAYVKTVHDDLNQHGSTVENNDKTAKDKEWRAYGDDHWDAEENRENRFRTAKSVVTSYNELDAVINKTKTVDQIKDQGFGAHDTVPKFSQQRQEGAEQTARNLNPASAWWKGLIKGGIGDVAKYAGEKIGNAWDWTKEKVGQGWDWTKKTAGDGLNWTKEKIGAGYDWTKETASNVWDGTKEKVGQGWDWTKKTAGDGVNWAKEKIGAGYDWTKKTASNAWDGTKNIAGQAWSGAKDLGHSAAKTAGDAWDGTKDAVRRGWSWLKKHL